MSADPNNFQDRVKKLRSLREKLCNQKGIWNDAFEVRDFVVYELQEMHQKLSESDTAPQWCKEKVEHILGALVALPKTKKTGD